MHHHRSEHWIVVSGTAEVEVDDKLIVLSENQSTYIPLGSKHRLNNPGRIPLVLMRFKVVLMLGKTILDLRISMAEINNFLYLKIN